MLYTIRSGGGGMTHGHLAAIAHVTYNSTITLSIATIDYNETAKYKSTVIKMNNAAKDDK